MTTRISHPLANLLVLVGLCAFAAGPARGASSDATVTVCNQGQININVVIGTEAPLPLFDHNLDVVAWLSIKPRECQQVYHGVGDYDSGSGIEYSYLGFGFFNAQKQMTAGHAARLPDLGYFTHGGRVLTAAGDHFCVRTSSVRYTIPEHAPLDCATFRSGANDPGGYTSFPTVLKIMPRPWGCDDRLHTCYSGDFYLDVTANPTSPEIQITGRVGDAEQPQQAAGAGSGSPVLQQLANAVAEHNRQVAQERADAAAVAQAQAKAMQGSNVCVPEELLAEWKNPQPGSKMEAFKRDLKGSLRERASSIRYDQSKWMTINSSVYATWNPAGRFQGVVSATDGGSCAVGHPEFFPLTP